MTEHLTVSSTELEDVSVYIEWSVGGSGTVPTFASVALLEAALSDGQVGKVGSTLYLMVSGSAVALYQEGEIPSFASVAALLAALSEGEYGTVSGVVYVVVSGAAEELVMPAVKSVSRSAANLPQSTQAPLFTVATGKVRILAITGEVTTQIQALANNAKLVANPTTGADVDLCATLNLTGDAVGTMYEITGTLTDALKTATSGALAGQTTPVVVAPGTIDLSCSASSTGQVKWTVHYVPIDSGATVTAA